MSKTLKTILAVVGAIAVLAAIAWFIYKKFKKQIDAAHEEWNADFEMPECCGCADCDATRSQ